MNRNDLDDKKVKDFGFSAIVVLCCAIGFILAVGVHLVWQLIGS